MLHRMIRPRLHNRRLGLRLRKRVKSIRMRLYLQAETVHHSNVSNPANL